MVGAIILFLHYGIVKHLMPWRMAWRRARGWHVVKVIKHFVWFLPRIHAFSCPESFSCRWYLWRSDYRSSSISCTGRIYEGHQLATRRICRNQPGWRYGIIFPPAGQYITRAGKRYPGRRDSKASALSQRGLVLLRVMVAHLIRITMTGKDVAESAEILFYISI